MQIMRLETDQESEHRRLFVDNTHGKHNAHSAQNDPYNMPWWQHLSLVLLIFPTTASCLLLASDVRSWEISGYTYTFITKYRTTVQIVVQIISNTLCLIQVLTICRLINLATRIKFAKSPVSLNTLGLWTALSTPTVNWSLPAGMITMSIVLVNFSTVMSALWAGALTPAITVGLRNGTVMIPDWTNISFIQEYPSEIDRTGLSVRDTKGFFTYSVGVGLLGSLVSAASSATTVDGSIRDHPKLDNTGFSYHGRSYGAGATVGLMDDSILSNPLATNYTFQDVAYETSVSCIYNHSSRFVIKKLYSDMLYAVRGELPDSYGSPEYSVYVGHAERAILAMGVSHVYKPNDTHYMAVTAGSYYDTLNSTQCLVHFTPAQFNVSVDIKSRNITVQKITATSIPSIDPTKNMTQIVTRQLELISNDLTSLYRSPLGDAFNASITDYRTSVANQFTNRPTEDNITLTGLENSVKSLLDDLLVGYASAQLMVGKFSRPVDATICVSSLRLGSNEYIIAISSIHGVVMTLVVIEAIRTRGWKGILSFDYLDNRMLVTSASMGGTAIADCAAVRDEEQVGKVPILLKRVKRGLQRFQITLGATGLDRAAEDSRNTYQLVHRTDRSVPLHSQTSSSERFPAFI